MMITRLNASLTMTLASFFMVNSNAFSPNSIAPLASLSRDSPKTSLNSHVIDNEEEAMILMSKARECASSDSCSIEDAESYLMDIMSVQGRCAAGTLYSAGLCEDAIFSSEIILSLREKIEKSRSAAVAQTKESLMQPFVLVLAMAYLVSGAITMKQFGADSFTAQEWLWAARDGYLGEMVSQYAKNGGLAPIDGSLATAVVPFTPQEWLWSIRDGYFGDMVSEYLQYGGLAAVDIDASDIAVTPFLPSEWAAAAKDGYMSDMISHYMRNGGL